MSLAQAILGQVDPNNLQLELSWFYISDGFQRGFQVVKDKRQLRRPSSYRLESQIFYASSGFLRLLQYQVSPNKRDTSVCKLGHFKLQQTFFQIRSVFTITSRLGILIWCPTIGAIDGYEAAGRSKSDFLNVTCKRIHLLLYAPPAHATQAWGETLLDLFKGNAFV
ncbi:hypothetical protein [Phaeobacter piscinae]|uniref:hypothetical protein n=1 Tax=Phaeobacter piscinae TaxID=1580596 RepID=UPI000C9BF41C|nr:hypothetical protein [Phaeobacter piscinae]